MENSNLSNIIVLTVNEENEKMTENLIPGSFGYFSKTMLPKELLMEINNAVGYDSHFNSETAIKMFIIVKGITDKKDDHQGILSERENEVLLELALGKQYKQIAEKLFVSVNTIHFHIKNIYQKFNVHSRPEAIAIALSKGLI